jgi:glycosyltransferase involved in cell wall biosynthesis
MASARRGIDGAAETHWQLLVPTVLSVAYPFAPVGPDSVGGAEQILAMLDQALVSAGWKSIVVGQTGSQVQDKLIELPMFAHLQSPSAYKAIQNVIIRTIREQPIDLVHAHGFDFDHYIPALDLPLVVTIHLPPEWYSPAAWSSDDSRIIRIAVSHSQARRFPHPSLVTRTIENGINLGMCAPSQMRGKFLLALGRICPEKGFHLAIEAAIRANSELILGGAVFPYEAHRKYFDNEIAPRLDSKRWFAGPLTHESKYRFLSAARALLIPSIAPETSSLVAMEALACGTPVIAFASGALPEIVTHAKTGFIVEDVVQMAEAINHVESIDRDYCRKEAVRRFSSTRMTAEYMALYEQVLSAQRRSTLKDSERAA